MILLDTHVILWALAGDPRLSKTARNLYEGTGDLRFSVVSLWEIGVKLGLDRPDFRLEGAWWQSIPGALVAQGAQRIDIDPEHCRILAGLPLHHRDPFDRMLIAQALHTGCDILSADTNLDRYPVKRLW